MVLPILSVDSNSVPPPRGQCVPCHELAYGSPALPPHHGLQHVARRERRTAGLGCIRWDYYRCAHCAGGWARQSDDLGTYWFASDAPVRTSQAEAV